MDCDQANPFNQQGEARIRQTVFGFKIGKMREKLTAHAGLALLAEYNHGLGLRELADRHMPELGSDRGYQVNYAGRVILKLAVDDEKFELFQRIRQDCYEVSLTP
jgi:hypothetical protein